MERVLFPSVPDSLTPAGAERHGRGRRDLAATFESLRQTRFFLSDLEAMEPFQLTDCVVFAYRHGDPRAQLIESRWRASVLGSTSHPQDEYGEPAHAFIVGGLRQEGLRILRQTPPAGTGECTGNGLIRACLALAEAGLFDEAYSAIMRSNHNPRSLRASVCSILSIQKDTDPEGARKRLAEYLSSPAGTEEDDYGARSLLPLAALLGLDDIVDRFLERAERRDGSVNERAFSNIIEDAAEQGAYDLAWRTFALLPKENPFVPYRALRKILEAQIRAEHDRDALETAKRLEPFDERMAKTYDNVMPLTNLALAELSERPFAEIWATLRMRKNDDHTIRFFLSVAAKKLLKAGRREEAEEAFRALLDGGGRAKEAARDLDWARSATWIARDSVDPALLDIVAEHFTTHPPTEEETATLAAANAALGRLDHAQEAAARLKNDKALVNSLAYEICLAHLERSSPEVPALVERIAELDLAAGTFKGVNATRLLHLVIAPRIQLGGALLRRGYAASGERLLDAAAALLSAPDRILPKDRADAYLSLAEARDDWSPEQRRVLLDAVTRIGKDLKKPQAPGQFENGATFTKTSLHKAALLLSRPDGTNEYFAPDTIPTALEDALERGDAAAVRHLGGICDAQAWTALRTTLSAHAFPHACLLFDTGYVETHIPTGEQSAPLFGPYADLARILAGADDPAPVAFRAVGRLLSRLDVPTPELRRAFLEAAAAGRHAPEAVLRLSPLLSLLVALDDKPARLEALRLAASPLVSDRRFASVARRLVAAGDLSETCLRFLRPPQGRDARALRHLVQQKPSQVRNLLELLAAPAYGRLSLADELPTLLEALNAFGTLTPVLYRRYRSEPTREGRLALAGRIRALKPRFFRNERIGDLLPQEDGELLAEMVMNAYAPSGMTFTEVTGLLARLEDRTHDLAGYRFPADGYAVRFGLSAYGLEEKDRAPVREALAHALALLPRESLDSPTIPALEEAAAHQAGRAPLSATLGEIARGGNDPAEEAIRTVLGLLKTDGRIVVNGQRAEEALASNDPGALRQAVENSIELLDLYVRDHLPAAISSRLARDPAAEARFFGTLAKPKNLRTLLGKLGRGKETLPADRDGQLALFAAFFQKTAVQKTFVRPLKRALGCFRPLPETVAERESARRYRLYVSKNAASFFAKASAGLCTANDLPLFHRADHFHLNLVDEDDRVCANIQAYLIADPAVPEKKSLLLRGLNPNVAFMDGLSIPSFCAEALRVAELFRAENGLADVYLSESLGNWHALSNRDAVQDYLVKKILPTCAETALDFPVTDKQSIAKIYRIKRQTAAPH